MLSYMFSFFGIIMIHLTLFEIIQWISSHSEVWVLIKPRFILPLVKNLTDSEVENKPDSEPLVYFDEKEPTEPITEPDRVKPIWKPRPPSNFDQAPITNDADLDESSYSETYESGDEYEKYGNVATKASNDEKDVQFFDDTETTEIYNRMTTVAVLETTVIPETTSTISATMIETVKRTTKRQGLLFTSRI